MFIYIYTFIYKYNMLSYDMIDVVVMLFNIYCVNSNFIVLFCKKNILELLIDFTFVNES